MIMKSNNDDKLSRLFADFDPEMKSAELFITRLENRLDSVEPVKQHLESMHRRNRIAVVASAVAGFIFGIIVAICYPNISAVIDKVSSHISTPEILPYTPVLGWFVIALIGMALMFFVYDTTRQLLQGARLRHRR